MEETGYVRLVDSDTYEVTEKLIDFFDEAIAKFDKPWKKV